MNEQAPSKELGCYVMDGVMYTSRADGSETSRKATDEEVLFADALLRATDELRGCSRELAIERRARSLADRHPNSNGTDAGSNPAGRSTHEPLQRLQRPFTTEEAKAYRAFIEEHFEPASAPPPVPEPLHEWKESDWTFDFRFLEQIRNSGPRDCFMPSLEGIECALLGYEQVTGRRLAETKEVKP